MQTLVSFWACFGAVFVWTAVTATMINANGIVFAFFFDVDACSMGVRWMFDGCSMDVRWMFDEWSMHV